MSAILLLAIINSVAVMGGALDARVMSLGTAAKEYAISKHLKRFLVLAHPGCQHGIALKRGPYDGTLIHPVGHFILPLKKAYRLQSSRNLS